MSKRIKDKAPFYALGKIVDEIAKTSEARNKLTKPILSEDKILEINENLGRALDESLEVKIAYFHNGKIVDIVGYIRKIDLITRNLFINDNIIALKIIVDVQLI